MCQVLIPTLCPRDRMTIKMQLGKSSLMVVNLSTKFIMELHTLVYLFVKVITNSHRVVASFQISQKERPF